jgi:hypothetical protein
MTTATDFAGVCSFGVNGKRIRQNQPRANTK